jgi:hypothetical protein
MRQTRCGSSGSSRPRPNASQPSPRSRPPVRPAGPGTRHDGIRGGVTPGLSDCSGSTFRLRLTNPAGVPVCAARVQTPRTRDVVLAAASDPLAATCPGFLPGGLPGAVAIRRFAARPAPPGVSPPHAGAGRSTVRAPGRATTCWQLRDPPPPCFRGCQQVELLCATEGLLRYRHFCLLCSGGRSRDRDP